MVDKMHLRRIPLFISAVLTIILVASSPGIAQNQTAYEGPGLDFSYPDQHMMFLKGGEENQFLDRNWTTVTGLPSGSVSFSKSSSFTLPTIVDAFSSQTQEPFKFEGNISVRLFASLESASNICLMSDLPVGGPLGSETQFSISLTMGGISAISGADTESIVMSKDRTDPHIFEVRAENVNISMNSGEEIRLSIQVRHECAVSGTLWWGTYDARTGVVFDGHIVETELDVIVDQNRMARIEFTPFSPWGVTDFSTQSIELVGPMPWSEMRHGKHYEDTWVDHFELPDGFSKGEGNRTVLNWITDRPLSPGDYMLDACLVLSDQDPGETCHSWVLLRFSVPADKSPILGSAAAAASVFLGMIAWVGVSMRGGQLPLPAYGAILLLAIASSVSALSLPEIDSNNFREGSAAPNFILLTHNPESGAESLSGLLDDSDVAVVGLFTPGSPNAKRQMSDFESAEKILAIDGLSASFAQIATGEDVKAYDLDDFSLEINGSWPLLLDDGTVGNSLPSGPTDSVFVIDSAGFIVSWSPGSMSPSDIQSASEGASFGSGKSPLDLLSMVTGLSLLPLLVLSMPSEKRYEAPEEALIPGVGIFMTMGASSSGFLAWAAPIAILSALGLGSHWIFLEILLSIIMVYHGVSMLTRGRIIEIEHFSRFLHSRMGRKYRVWRGGKRFSEDVYLGLWLAWLAWIIDPSMIAQGVGSMARSGILGTALSPLMLIGFGISAGLAVSIFRSLPLLLGKYTAIIGLLSVGIRPRAWGVSVAIMGFWTLISIFMGLLAFSY
ncbi:MAG TPA: hypothetical protein EYQ11_03910 [Candidatus Poseidoniales archaeon]|jgi:hypothetical protein|nr:MAG: hypothetical protein CXT66_00175 [Euryarchaeota archaeon]HIG34007.1 hypothetical protein [Candidatus Poseidoniales archaeon]HIL67517.1 hypothetical protein [Candidatus Poseidoniales archaeon]